MFTSLPQPVENQVSEWYWVRAGSQQWGWGCGDATSQGCCQEAAWLSGWCTSTDKHLDSIYLCGSKWWCLWSGWGTRYSWTSFCSACCRWVLGHIDILAKVSGHICSCPTVFICINVNYLFLLFSCDGRDQYRRWGSAATSPNGCRQTGAVMTAPSNWGYAGWSGSSWWASGGWNCSICSSRCGSGGAEMPCVPPAV